jgi:hypothetical protein
LVSEEEDEKEGEFEIEVGMGSEGGWAKMDLAAQSLSG